MKMRRTTLSLLAVLLRHLALVIIKAVRALRAGRYPGSYPNDPSERRLRFDPLGHQSGFTRSGWPMLVVEVYCLGGFLAQVLRFVAVFLRVCHTQ